MILHQPRDWRTKKVPGGALFSAIDLEKRLPPLKLGGAGRLIFDSRI